MVYGGFWRRFAADMIDGFILIIPSMILHYVLPYVGGVILAILYTPFFQSSAVRGTPGKIFMGLQICREDGGRLSFGQCLARYFLAYVSALFLGFGYLMNLFTTRRQTFHDLVVGAVVIYEPRNTDIDWIATWSAEFRRVFASASASAGAAGTEGPAPERRVYEAHATRVEPDVTPSRPSAGLETLEQLHRLYQAGALTEAEYQAKKDEILKNI